MTPERKRWDVNHLSNFAKLLADQKAAPIMKQTVEFKDYDGLPITFITSSIKSICKSGSSVYLNMVNNESVEISNDYYDARDILHDAYHQPVEYYALENLSGQLHYIPVLQVRNIIEDMTILYVYLSDGTELRFGGKTPEDLFNSKVQIKG